MRRDEILQQEGQGLPIEGLKPALHKLRQDFSQEERSGHRGWFAHCLVRRVLLFRRVGRALIRAGVVME